MVSKPAFVPRIVIIEGKDKGKVIQLENGTAVIGRSKGDVLIQDPRVSRSHVAIHFDSKAGHLTFTDLKSLNGTQVNGETKEAGDLKDGDRLQLGNTVFDCQISAPAEMTQPRFKPLETQTDRQEPFLHPPQEEASVPTFVPESHPAVEDRTEDTRSGVQISLFQRLKYSFSQRPRVFALSGLVVVLLGLYVWVDRVGSPKKANPLEREVTSIRRLETEGRFAEAVAKAEELSQKHPDWIDIHILLGGLYSQQGKWDLAVQALERATKVDRNHGVAHVRLARFYLLASRQRDAELENREIERILIEGPHSKDFFVELANLYIDFRQLDVQPKKMVIVGQALQNKFAPGETIGMKLEAVGLILDGMPQEAVAILEKLKTLDTSDSSVYQYLVLARVRMKDPLGALNVAHQWIQAFPKDTRPLLYMAHWKYENKELQDSLSILQKLESIVDKGDNPALASALNLMGKIYLDQNQRAQAETAIRRSCELGFQPSCDHELLKQPPLENPPPAQAKGHR